MLGCPSLLSAPWLPRAHAIHLQQRLSEHERPSRVGRSSTHSFAQETRTRLIVGDEGGDYPVWTPDGSSEG